MKAFKAISISFKNNETQRENDDNCTPNGTATDKNIIKEENKINKTDSFLQDISNLQKTATACNPICLQTPSTIIKITNKKTHVFDSTYLNKNFNSENNLNILREGKKSMKKFCSLEIIPQKRSTSPDVTQESCLRLQSNEEDADNASDEETETCWAWVVLLACIYNQMIITGYPLAFGIQFDAIIDKMGLSSTTVSWVFSVMYFMWNMTSAITGPLCRLLGWRTVGFWAALVAAVSFTLLSFTTSPGYLFFFYGVVLGTAAGIGHHTTQVILPAYFTKRRGLAFGLTFTFIGVGQICTPLIIAILVQEFGYMGSILLRGGMALNCCVTTLLFRPLKSMPVYMKPISSTAASSKHIIETNTIVATLKQLFDETSSYIRQCLQALKTFTILINIFSFCSFFVGFANFSMLVPFAMMSAGHSPQDAALALSCMALSNCSVGLMVSLMSDCSWFSKKRAHIAGTLVAAGGCFGFIFALPHLTWVLVLMLVWGAGIGICIILRLPLLIDTVGMSDYMPAVGATGFVMAVAFASIGPIFGVVRDASASYASSLAACASLQLCSGLVWFLHTQAERADAKKKKQTQAESADVRRDGQTRAEPANARTDEQTRAETADARNDRQTRAETADARNDR